MYQVNIGTNILYYPGSDDAVIYDTELTEDVGLAGEFRFKVPPKNPQYSQLSNGSLVTILKDGKEFWRGEIRDVQTDFSKIASVYALEDLAWLADEFIAPAKVTNETYAQRLTAAITAYNANRSPDRQFTVGYITNVSSSNNCNWATEYEWSILDSLRECICNASEDSGYIRVRRVTLGGSVTRYIDIVKLSDYGTLASQTIEYGYNLLDYVEEMDYGNLTNVLTPYGAEQEAEVYTDYSSRVQGTTITNTTSVGIYGRHAKAVVFDGVETTTQLNALAQSYLTRYSQPQLTMEVQAVDLAEIENVDAIKIGDSVHIIAEPFAIDQILYLTQIKRDLQNIDKNTITMSGRVTRGKSLTSQVNSAATSIEDLPSKWNILEAAKKNALALLLDETQGGHVVFEYDANNKYIEAISICNASTIANSTKRWRWSQNGFGYMYRSSVDPTPWESVAVAIDLNGNITANAITTGTMVANRISGGTLTLGGLGNTNGVASIRDANGNECVKISNEGIDIKKGLLAGLTVDNSEKGLSFNSPISGIDHYFKLTAWGGLTCGRQNGSSTAPWMRMDYVQQYGLLKVDYGNNSGEYHGVIVTNAGNNTYNNPGSHYTKMSHNDFWSSDSGSVAWAGSDRKLKKNIVDLALEKAKKLINSVRPREFEFKAKQGKRYGFIAQELREVLDDNSGIEYESSGTRNINYSDFIAPLCMVVQDLQNQINELKGERNG